MAGRHRGFNYVFYPESAPENFREIIASWNVPALLALHDKDAEKKPHYHLLLTFGGKKSLAQVHELVDQLGSKVVEPAWDVHASARYLGHLDQPDKFQYGVAAIEAFAGQSVADLTAPIADPSPEILAFVRHNCIDEYSTLIDYCLDEKPEWYRWASSHSIFMCAYLRSVRGVWEARRRV
jgi:hypothetical protein